MGDPYYPNWPKFYPKKTLIRTTSAALSSTIDAALHQATTAQQCQRICADIHASRGHADSYLRQRLGEVVLHCKEDHSCYVALANRSDDLLAKIQLAIDLAEDDLIAHHFIRLLQNFVNYNKKGVL